MSTKNSKGCSGCGGGCGQSKKLEDKKEGKGCSCSHK